MTDTHTQSTDAPARRGAAAFIEAMRPTHWVKNAFVAAPLLFARRFAEPAAWVACLAAVGAFCLLSSAVYLLNDVCDRRKDQAHPVKRNRAVASGRLSLTAALLGAMWLAVAGGVLVAVAMAVPLERRSDTLAGWGLALWTGLYLLLNLLYSLWLKDRVVVDVILVAFFFVLRAMAGAAAIAVPISPYLVVCTFSLCLFIALTKRRGEMLSLGAAQAAQARRPQRAYDPVNLEHMLTVSAAVAVMTYMLYCVAPRTVHMVGSAHMIWTIPLVVYGLFRFYLLTRKSGAQDPVVVLARDKVMWLVLLAYAVLVMLVLKLGGRPGLRDILDAGQ